MLTQMNKYNPKTIGIFYSVMATILVIIFSLILYFLMDSIIIISFLLALSIGISVGNLVRNGRFYSNLHESANNNYFQLESLAGLYASLNVTAPLPSMRGWSISPDIANFIVRLILERKPKMILEYGSGVSTIIMAYCLKIIGSGQIISLEHNPDFRSEILSYVESNNLMKFVSVKYCPLSEVRLNDEPFKWYDTTGLKLNQPIDFVFIDGPQSIYRYPSIPFLEDKLSKSAMIVVDDADSPNVKKILQLWLDENPTLTSNYKESEKGAVLLELHME